VRSKLTYANVVATMALIVAVAGTGSAVAAVIINSNSQVARETISGHAPPSGDHANLVTGSVNGTDFSSAYKAAQRAHLLALKVKCPIGMMLLDSLCFDPDLRPMTDYFTALRACATRGLRLPTPAELMIIFSAVAPRDNEWVGQPFAVSTNTYAMTMDEDQFGNVHTHVAQLNGTTGGPSYRCVTTPVN
jgi:hypothetical protein